jgi:hypothetical protein
MFPNNTSTWTETSFLNWSLLITSNKVLYKLPHVSSVYSIASNLWQQTNMRAFRFPHRCNGGLLSSWMRRHVTEQRRWPWNATSYPRRKKASTQAELTNLEVRCYEMSYTFLLRRLSRTYSNCIPPLERATNFPTHKKRQHNYSCVLQKIPEHLRLSTYTSQKQSMWNMKAELITAYFVLQIPLARMTAYGNKRSES